MKWILLIFVLFFVACGSENQQVDIECKEGNVYNTKIEKCVVDLCLENESLGDEYSCVEGCIVQEKNTEYYIFCEKENE